MQENYLNMKIILYMKSNVILLIIFHSIKVKLEDAADI